MIFQLYAKILRTADAQAMEAHTTLKDGSDPDKSAGRAQVINLLTIDAETVAGLAYVVWNITNGLTTREGPAIYA